MPQLVDFKKTDIHDIVFLVSNIKLFGASGFSLIMIIPLLLVFGTILAGLMLSQNARAKESLLVLEKEHREYLGRWLKTGIDCAKTNTLTCSGSGGYVAVPRKGGVGAPNLIDVPTASANTVLGRYELRAACTGTGPRTFIIETRRLGTANWSPLLGTDPLICT